MEDNYIFNDQELTYSRIADRMLLFQWVKKQENISMQLWTALASNLAKLEVQGKEIAYSLAGQDVDSEELIEQLFASAKSKRPASYELFVSLGYNEPFTPQYHSPIKELQAIKLANDIKRRGLTRTEKGDFVLNSNVFARYVQTRLKLVQVQGQGFYLYSKEGYWKAPTDLRSEWKSVLAVPHR